MAVSVHYLSNGIPVLIDRDTNHDVAAAGIYVGVGSRYETKEENGAAHNLEHMAFKGTKKRTARQLIVEMENMGASTNAFTGQEGTMYYVKGLSQDIVKFADLLSDIAANSQLPKKEMETERGVIVEEIGGYADDPTSVMGDNAMMTAFPGQPLGATILGPVENIKNFKRSTLKKFMNKHYHAGNMVVTVSGNVDPATVVAAFEKGIGHMPRKTRSIPAAANYVGGRSHTEKELNQLQLMVQFNGAAKNDKDKASQMILASILGGGMSSRLFEEVREKRGLVYSVASWTQSFNDTGLFGIYAGLNPARAGELLPVLCDELKKVREHGVTAEELARAKARVKVALAFQETSINSRMLSMPEQFLRNGRVATGAEQLQELEAVTLESVKAAANKVFAGKPTVTSVGMGQNIEAYDKIVARLKL